MPWFKVDDGFATHPKAVRAGNSAVGLWTRAGSWSAQHLTEGFIPTGILSVLGGRQRDAERLVEAELWSTVEGGYQFHQWAERQPAKVQVEAEREAARERQRRARKRAKLGRDSRGESQGSHAVTNAVTNAKVMPLVTVPPSLPDPTVVPNGTTTPSTQSLLGEWIDHCIAPPPGRVKGQVAKEVKAMLDEGIPYERVRQGLAAWQQRGLHPSTLASVVHEMATPRVNGKQQETDDLFGAALERARANDRQELTP
jgi:hypothetical protein